MKAALLAGALLLGLFNFGSDVKTISEIEGDQRSLREAREVLDEARERAREDLRRAGDDPIVKARAELVLEGLDTIERRVNPTAMMRQVQQTKESFLDKEKPESAGGALISLVDALQDKTNNAENAVNLLKIFWESISLPEDRSRPLTGAEILERIEVQAGSLERFGPLPPEIGDYLAWTTLMDTARTNPQIASLSGHDQAVFLCDQTRKRLNRLLRDERDNARIMILQLALEQLARHCPDPDRAPSDQPNAAPVDCDAYARSVSSGAGEEWMYEPAYNMCVNDVLRGITPRRGGE